MSDAGQSRERQLEMIRRNMGDRALEALADPMVIEIIRNADGRLWLDIAGRGLVDTGATISDNCADQIVSVAATVLKTSVTREHPILEGEFPLDGSRLQAIIPPIVASPIFAIRKKANVVFTLDDYAAKGMLRPGSHVEHAHRDYWASAPSALLALKASVAQHANILIVGGTSSGKTTLANALNAEIAKACPHDRVIAIEDTQELQLTINNHVLLRASEHASMQRLLRATMRLRPDRIIVGEVRGGEAYTLLKAWNSGHPGGMATIHADSAREGLQKLTDYVFESPDAAAFSEERMGRVIASTVQIVLFIERIGEAPGRAVSEISRVRGFKNGSFELEPVSFNGR